MNAALITVLMAAIGTALLAFVGFKLGLNVERRLKDSDEVIAAVCAYVGTEANYHIVLSNNHRAALAYGDDQSGYVVTVLGDKRLVRSLQDAKIMVVAPDRLYVSFADLGFEPVHIHAEKAAITAALAGLGRREAT